MEQEYTEDNGMDPGLSEGAYDGAEYGFDEFGERLNTEDAPEESMAEDEMKPADTPESAVEDGFGEAISPETNPHIEDQLNDEKLHEDAESDNKA